MTAAGVQVESLRNALRGETRSVGRLGRACGRPRRRLQHAGRARDLPPLGARGGARRAAPRPCGLRARRARRRRRGSCRRSSALARARAEARAARDFAESDRLRDEIAAARLGGAGRAERGGRLRARAALVTRELVYGRNAVREALRGRREVLELWVSERAAASLDWLGEGPRAAGRQGARPHRGGRKPRPPGRRRLGGPVSVRRSVGARGAARRRCSPASTRSPTRGTSAP